MKLEPRVDARPRVVLPDGSIRVAGRYGWATARAGFGSLVAVMLTHRALGWLELPTPWDEAAAGTVVVVWGIVLLLALLPARIVRFNVGARECLIRTRPELLRAHRIVIPFSKLRRVELDDAGALLLVTDEGPLEVAHFERADDGRALAGEINALLERCRTERAAEPAPTTPAG